MSTKSKGQKAYELKLNTPNLTWDEIGAQIQTKWADRYAKQHAKRNNLKWPLARPCERHDKAGGPEYRSWRGMKQRCDNPNCDDYKNYGARGIKICERWKSFKNFYDDMGPRPEPKDQYSLDRIDNNGNYEPGNCRWATYSQQRQNQRPK